MFAAVAMTGSAFAADMAVKARPPAPIAPVYNWTGFYVGLNAGGGFGRTGASEPVSLTPALWRSLRARITVSTTI